MPRTKPKPKPQSPIETNGALGDVLNLAEAAAYLRLSEADVLRLIREQGLPARQLDDDWRLLKAAIQEWLRSGPPPKSSKEAFLSLAGVWKDDPYVEAELKEIYKRRGRPMTEDDA